MAVVVDEEEVVEELHDFQEAVDAVVLAEAAAVLAVVVVAVVEEEVVSVDEVLVAEVVVAAVVAEGHLEGLEASKAVKKL